MLACGGEAVASVVCEQQQVTSRPVARALTASSPGVIGKGDMPRQVSVPHRLVDELQDEFKGQRLEPDVQHESNRNVWSLIRLEAGTATPWSASGLANGIKTVLERSAAKMSDEDAKQLRKASSHWSRHTHGAHARSRPSSHGRCSMRLMCQRWPGSGIGRWWV